MFIFNKKIFITFDTPGLGKKTKIILLFFQTTTTFLDINNSETLTLCFLYREDNCINTFEKTGRRKSQIAHKGEIVFLIHLLSHEKEGTKDVDCQHLNF